MDTKTDRGLDDLDRYREAARFDAGFPRIVLITGQVITVLLLLLMLFG